MDICTILDLYSCYVTYVMLYPVKSYLILSSYLKKIKETAYLKIIMWSRLIFSTCSNFLARTTST